MSPNNELSLSLNNLRWKSRRNTTLEIFRRTSLKVLNHAQTSNIIYPSLNMVSLLCKFTSEYNCSTTNEPIASGVLLRHDPRILKLPKYLSFLCIVIGVAWLLVLPLDNYSRKTYISENALLPGQVHTYFAGSDQNIFRGYKQEVDGLEDKSNPEY